MTAIPKPEVSFASLIHPTPGRIMVKVREADEKSAAGLILTPARSIQEQRPTQGEVVAVPPEGSIEDGDLTEPMFKVGDIVIFGKFSGTELTCDRQKFIILNEKDVLCTMDIPDHRVKVRA
jgi:chaperonin GroES